MLNPDLRLKETWKSTLIDDTLDRLVQNTLQTELANLSSSTIQEQYAEFKRTIKSRLIENLTQHIIEQLTVWFFVRFVKFCFPDNLAEKLAYIMIRAVKTNLNKL